MIDWLNIRQRAVDDAKARYKHSNVEVYVYTEVGMCAHEAIGQACMRTLLVPLHPAPPLPVGILHGMLACYPPGMQSLAPHPRP